MAIARAALVLLALWAGSALAGAPAGSTGPRPNIVVFVLDDVSAEDLGAYGNPGIRTPVIDRLAAEGWRFDNAFLTTSICSPSRISLLTGRYPHATGARQLHQPVPPDQVLLSRHLRQAGYFTASAGKWHMGPYARSQFDRVLESQRGAVLHDWLDVVQHRPAGKPFFLWLSTYDAHRPFDAAVTLHGHAPARVRVPAGLVDDVATRADLAAYYAMIHRADTEIGLLLQVLASQGVLQDTVVMLVADNGRSFPWAKSYLYDSSLRTPLIIRWPARLQPQVSDVLASSVDIAPTVLEWLGLPVPAAMQGHSLAGVMAGSAPPPRDAVFAERNWRGIYSGDARSVRTRDYLYIRNYLSQGDTCLGNDSGNPSAQSLQAWRDTLGQRCFPSRWPEEELYELASDPQQQRNRAADPGMAGVLQSMRERLQHWQHETADYRSARHAPLSAAWCQSRPWDCH